MKGNISFLRWKKSAMKSIEILNGLILLPRIIAAIKHRPYIVAGNIYLFIYIAVLLELSSFPPDFLRGLLSPTCSPARSILSRLSISRLRRLLDTLALLDLHTERERERERERSVTISIPHEGDRPLYAINSRNPRIRG